MNYRTPDEPIDYRPTAYTAEWEVIPGFLAKGVVRAGLLIENQVTGEARELRDRDELPDGTLWYRDPYTMTRDDLVRECHRLNVHPRGGLSRATLTDLRGWVQINRPKRRRQEG